MLSQRDGLLTLIQHLNLVVPGANTPLRARTPLRLLLDWYAFS
jgi:hypothetical protein